MSLVARGLGLGAGAVLVTAGFGLSITVIPPIEPPPAPNYGGPGAPPQRLRLPPSAWRREEEEILTIIAIALRFMNR